MLVVDRKTCCDVDECAFLNKGCAQVKQTFMLLRLLLLLFYCFFIVVGVIVAAASVMDKHSFLNGGSPQLKNPAVVVDVIDNVSVEKMFVENVFVWRGLLNIKL